MSKPPFTMSKYACELDLLRDKCKWLEGELAGAGAYAERLLDAVRTAQKFIEQMGDIRVDTVSLGGGPFKLRDSGYFSIMKSAVDAAPANDQAGSAKAAGAPGAESTAAPTNTDVPLTVSSYRKKPVVIQATQWFKMGDHAAVRMIGDTRREARQSPSPAIETLEGPHYVTPGDWIITGIKGEFYPCKPDIFAATYEPAHARVERSPTIPDGWRLVPREATENMLNAYRRAYDEAMSVGNRWYWRQAWDAMIEAAPGYKGAISADVAPKRQRREPYWFIERGAPAEWMASRPWMADAVAFGSSAQPATWTRDSFKARRFSSQDEAVRMIEAYDELKGCIATEHLDVDVAPEERIP